MTTAIPSEFAPIFARLKKLKPQPNGNWEACCPSHEDNEPSLSVKIQHRPDGSTKLLLNCHGKCGCTFRSIAQSLQIDERLFFIDPPEAAARRGCRRKTRAAQARNPVAFYSYRDERGALLYQTVRFEPKDFSQRRPRPGGGWDWSLGDVRRVLYRTAELLHADPDEPVFVLEGEKNVEAAESIGLLATTNVGGAGKWRPEYGDQLAGRKVVAVCDFDPVDPRTGRRPGWEHGRMVGNGVTGIAEWVKVIKRLPLLREGQDFYDWVARFAGDRKRARRALADEVNALPRWTPEPDPDWFTAFSRVQDGLVRADQQVVYPDLAAVVIAVKAAVAGLDPDDPADVALSTLAEVAAVCQKGAEDCGLVGKAGAGRTVAVHVKDGCDVSVMRPGPFGNPYPLDAKADDAARDACLDRFERYFCERVEKDGDFRTAVLNLRGKRLGCVCKPKRCHADVIAAWVDAHRR